MKHQRIILFAFTLSLGAVITITHLGRKAESAKAKSTLPVLSVLKPFELRDQEDRPFNLDAMKGTVQIIDFIFANCPGPCTMLTSRMKLLETNTRELGDKVHFISITVDPENDSPLVLKLYGLKHGLDFNRWSLLTGPLRDVESVVIAGFNSEMEKRRIPASEAGRPDLIQITHGEKFVLVDRLGRLRAFHSALSDQDVDEVLQLVKELVAEPVNLTDGIR